MPDEVIISPEQAEAFLAELYAANAARDAAGYEKIKVVHAQDGSYRELGCGATWTRTAYTNGACSDGVDCEHEDCELGHDLCASCGKIISEDSLFGCLDDGSVAAHIACVEVLGSQD